ncbi:MAG: SemiSWEET transporter [Ginsengibacter sp.]
MSTTTIIGLLAAIATTSSFLPQALKTIQTRNTFGISLGMYSIFSFGTLLWFIYGIMDIDWPIIIANGITLIFACVILAYKIRYK